MKKLLLVITVCFIGCAPKIVPHDNNAPFQFTVIDTIQGMIKNDLYVKVYEWVAKTYNSAKDVIQMNDKEAGKIIAKAAMAVPGQKDNFGMAAGNDYVHYTISIDVKEGKYRCTLSDFYHKAGIYKNASCSGGSLDNDYSNCTSIFMSTNRWRSIKEIVTEDAEANLEALKKYVRIKQSDF